MSNKKLAPIEIARPDVFRHHSYRDFLKDWFDFLKSSQSTFSLRKLAGQAKIAKGYLPMVLSGERRLTESALEKLLPHLQLTPSEAAYLRSLRGLGEATSQEERLESMKRMNRFHSFREKSPKELEVYKYLTKWFYVAIREMAMMEGFQPKADWIQERLLHKVSTKEINEAMRFLFDNGFWEKRSDGGIAISEKRLECFGGIFKLSLAQFHRQMFALAAQSIDTVVSEERNILGHTFAIAEKDFSEAKRILDEALEKIAELESKSQSKDRVYHVGLAAFPLTGTGKGK